MALEQRLRSATATQRQQGEQQPQQWPRPALPALAPVGREWGARQSAPPATSALTALGAHWPSSEFRPTHRLSRSQLCSVVAKVAEAGHVPSRSWLSLTAEMTRPHLRSLSPRQLAVLISSFVAMRYNPGEDFLADFDTAVVSHPHAFDPASITDILACLAALGATWTRFPCFVALRLSVAAAAHASAHSSSLGPHAGGGDVAMTSGNMAAAHVLDAWSYPQLSLTLRCLHSYFGLPLDDATLHALGCCMARQLTGMEPQELQTVLAMELARPVSQAAAGLHTAA